MAVRLLGSRTTTLYGCGKWFAWYRRSDGYKLEATYSRKLSELGKVKFVCNSSGFENKFGRAGVLIGSKNNDPNMYPHVVMNIWKTTQQLISGYVNMTFEGTVSWVTDPNRRSRTLLAFTGLGLVTLNDRDAFHEPSG